MEEMLINQWEHLVPKVYLKQWEKNGFLTIMNCKERTIKKDVTASEFNKRLNFYDINWHESDLAKHNEIELGRLENDYLTFLRTIKNQQGIHVDKWQAYCDRLVALMFVRTETYWKIFNEILSDSQKREKLLNEIYHDNESGLNLMRIVLNVFSQTYPANLILCDLASYIQNRLKYFNQIILQTNADTHPFITSTNPVIIVPNSIDTSTVFHWSSEIYFPLSPEFCLYMYHPSFCPFPNELQNLPPKKISAVVPKFVWDFSTKLKLLSGSHEFVMPFELDSKVFDPLSKNELQELDSELGGFFK